MAKAYAHKFVRVTISGTAHVGSEIWSTGFQMGSPTVSMTDVTAPAASSIGEAWRTFFTTAANKFSNYYTTTQVKCALINEDGTTDVDKIDYWTPASPIIGGHSATGPLPPQVSLAATLTSDNQRGLASKGRMYLPGVAEPVDGASGKIAVAYRDTLIGNFKLFLDAVNNGLGVPGKIVLASAGHKTQQLDENGQPQYLAGRTARVTGCRIGNVYDTQRRRRNNLTEAYATRVLA